MNSKIFTKEVQNFIEQNLKSNLSQLVLKGSPFDEISIQEIAQQIVGQQKAEKKLPTWFQNKNIYYPPKLNLEQTSSEITAKYKSHLVSGQSCADLTGGFGIDTYYLSKSFQKIIHCEINKDLSEIVKHNFIQLDFRNISFYQGDGLSFLSSSNQKFDCIYIDPSRRNDTKGKVFLLEDCLPNIPENLDLLFNYSDSILIKYSPMLDIELGINKLKYVDEVHVVAVENEVKELLFLLRKLADKKTQIKTINIKKKQQEKFNFFKGKSSAINYSEPLNFLYEPNKSILKAKGYLHLSYEYDVNKLHKDSHLFTSKVNQEFPGRKFEIQKIVPFHKKEMKSLMKQKVNVTCRNFPLTAPELKKRFKLKDGGIDYLFFTTDIDDNLMIIYTKKVS